MNALTFTIELLEPMLATGLEGDPNAGVSQPFIAGSVLRGAIIKLYQNKKGKIDAAETEVRNLFFNGKVCFLNAYPLVRINRDEEIRSFPVPLSWQKVKDQTEENGKPCFNFAIERKDDTQYKGLNTKFFAFKDEGNQIIKAEIKTRIAVHNQRDAQKGRATKDNGEVYRYESIEKGIKFGGVILSENPTFLDTIKKLFDETNEIIVGGSRTGGYGRAKITVNPVIDQNYRESKRWQVAEINEGDSFTVTLLSNALIRDENGQFQSDLRLENTNPECDKTFKKLELVGGFNRKWGMTLPQMQSIKAGSVFTFKATSRITSTTIQNWLDNGISERNLDGFGRIAINLNTHPDLTFAESHKVSVGQVPLSTSNGLRNGQKIVNRLYKIKLEGKLIENLSSIKFDFGEKSNHQIHRLRDFLHLILRENPLNSAKEIRSEIKTKFFDELRRKAKDKFEKLKISIENTNEKNKIEDWILDDVFGENSDLFNAEKITLGKDSEKVESEAQNLTLKYRLLLIDKVLERATKER
jgi:CRISPR-associated protein Csx10